MTLDFEKGVILGDSNTQSDGNHWTGDSFFFFSLRITWKESLNEVRKSPSYFFSNQNAHLCFP